VTATLSEAVKVVIETANAVEVEGSVKALTVGGVASDAAGILAELPGNVLALISTIFVKVSPSESCGSMVAKLLPLFMYAVP
jgi:hypothetical protein